MARVWQQHMEDVLSRWSKSDREALASLLERFVEDLRSMRYRSLTDEAAG
jgi:hypothetical protein